MEALSVADCRIVEQLIIDEVEKGVPESQIVVVGFGQGGAVALSMLWYLDHLSGIVGVPLTACFCAQYVPSLLKV